MERMEGKNNGHPEGCRCIMCQGRRCGMCGGGMHCGGKYRIIRWILGILILIGVFSAGIKLGELKAAVGGGYGYNPYRMMRENYYGYYPGYGMMVPWNGTQQQQAPAATPSK